nr:MAG TPA: hypothetical protein [Caudoviricetes sp.]
MNCSLNVGFEYSELVLNCALPIIGVIPIGYFIGITS